MRNYFDTSALLKAYVREAGTAQVQKALRTNAPLVSRITHAELVCAIGRAHREGIIDQGSRDRLWDRVEADMADFDVVEVRAAVLDRVRALVARHPLRGYDAVQLATALAIAQRKTPLVFWSTDLALLAAARAEGLRVQQPSG
jgi:predicted nucleic acid-binding protein